MSLHYVGEQYGVLSSMMMSLPFHFLFIMISLPLYSLSLAISSFVWNNVIIRYSPNDLIGFAPPPSPGPFLEPFPLPSTPSPFSLPPLPPPPFSFPLSSPPPSFSFPLSSPPPSSFSFPLSSPPPFLLLPSLFPLPTFDSLPLLPVDWLNQLFNCFFVPLSPLISPKIKSNQSIPNCSLPPLPWPSPHPPPGAQFLIDNHNGITKPATYIVP